MSKVSVLDPNRLPIHTGNAQHIGRRESQQDAWGFSDLADEAFARHGGYLAVLADGMGGLENGLWASSHGVGAFIAAYRTKTPDEPIAQALNRAIAHANRIVHAEAVRLGMDDRMGTTLVAAVLLGRKLHWVSVGDSRVYVCTAGQLLRLSTDHNFSEVLAGRVRRGEISLDEAQAHPMRNGLTSYLGRRQLADVDMPTAPLELAPGTWVLLCSDGLSGVLRDDEIVHELHGVPQEAADRLVSNVLRRAMPHQDNVTAVLFQVPAGSAQLTAGGKTITRPFAGRKPKRNLPLWVGSGALSMALLLAGYGLLQPLLVPPMSRPAEAVLVLPGKEPPTVTVVLPAERSTIGAGLEPKLPDGGIAERKSNEKAFDASQRTQPAKNKEKKSPSASSGEMSKKRKSEVRGSEKPADGQSRQKTDRSTPEDRQTAVAEDKAAPTEQAESKGQAADGTEAPNSSAKP